MINTLDFKYEFLINSLNNLLRMLTNQLLSIFIIQDENVITFLRNHPAINIEFLCQLLTQHIRHYYAQPINNAKKSIQQAIDFTISQLRCYQQPYNHKKYIIFSDFSNFSYSPFQTFDLWDTQGYQFSINAIFIGSLKLTGYETFKIVIDPQVIEDYMENMNGFLYDINLLNKFGEKINIDEFQQPQPKIIIYQTKTLLGQYQTNYPQELLKMRIKEGFKGQNPLSIRINDQMGLSYEINDQNVFIYQERTISTSIIQLLQKKAQETEQLIQNSCKTLFEMYQQRDYQQEIILKIKNKLISFEDGIKLLIENKAFENQKFINRYYKQISLVYLIRAIDFRQFQEEGEEFNKYSFYQYIRQKIQEVGTKKIENCLLYQQGKDFVLIRVIWHSHTILRLICIYENDEMLPNLQNRIREVFKSNQILRNSLIEFDHSLKNLLIKSEADYLKKNPDIFVLEQQWEWPKSQIWDMQSMYRILTSLRVKSNYYRVPSINDRNNKFFVAQIEQDQKIVIVQNLILQDDKIICNIFTENLITNVRYVLLDYFQKIKEFEKQIIISLHTAHCMYRQALIKKQNSNQVDFFTIQFLQRKFTNVEQYLKAFREYAQQQAAYYPPPSNNLDYNSLIEKAYVYQIIKQKKIDSENKYLQVLQQIADHCVYKTSTNKDLIFIAIGPQRMLMISYDTENTTFYLISLEQLERNHKPHSFLTSALEKKIDVIINYVQQEYNSVFAKEIHFQYTQGLPVTNLKSAIEDCQIEKLEFDLNQEYKDVQQLYDLQPRKITRRQPSTDDSPLKQLKKTVSSKQDIIKSKFCKLFCEKWQERLIKLMSEHKISMKLINERWYYYDKQDRNETILFLNMAFKEIQSKNDNKDNKDIEIEYGSVQELFESQRNNKQKKNKIVIQYQIYYYLQRNLQKLLNEGIEIVNQIEDLTSITRKIQRWSDPFRKYNNEFTKKFQLEVKRLLPINEDNIQTIYQLIDGMEQKIIEFKITDKRFDHNFTNQFSNEIHNTGDEHKFFKFINIQDEYFIFILNSENCNLDLFNDFQLEREYLIEEQQIVPFWFIIRIQDTQLQIQTYTEYQYDSIRIIINQLKQLIIEILDRTFLYFIVKKATESTIRVKFLLRPHFEIEEEVQVVAEQPQQQQIFTARKQWKNKTQVQNQVQEIKEYAVPFVGWRVFHPYQLKKPYVQHLLNNTLFMNHQIDYNQYYGSYRKESYIFLFQAVKNIQNYSEKYPELCQEVLAGQISVIMNVYSTNRNEQLIKENIDYFYEHIKNNVDEDLINALSQGVIRNPRLKEQEFQLIQRGQQSYMQILLNENIKDLLAFSCFMRHNLEKTFCKYEIQQQQVQTDKGKSDAQLQDPKYLVDLRENSFMFSKYKVIYSPNVNMSNFFGQGLCLLNFVYQVDGNIVISYQFPKQPKNIHQHELLKIPSHLPTIQYIKEQGLGTLKGQGEVCYDITQNYNQKFLIIDIISRGSLQWEAFKEFFQVLVRQVELEYQMELIHLNKITIDNLDKIESTFNSLQHYSFKLHHFVYPLYYEEIDWNTTMNLIANKIYAEFEKKGINQQITQQFEQQQKITSQDSLGHSYQVLVITDGLDYDQASTLDTIKHFTQLKQKKNDPIDFYHRSVLVYVKLTYSKLELFLYNLNCDIAANLNHQIGILSRWSIIRNQVAQKIKNDIQGCYNIRLSPFYEEIFMQKHNIYQNSIVNDLLRLRSQDQINKKIKKEDQPDQYTKLSEAIQCIINKKYPPQDIQLFEFVKHLEKFLKLNFSVVKPKKLIIDYNMEAEFLQKEGQVFLDTVKDFYKNFIQTQQIKYVKLMLNKTDQQSQQSKPILDKALKQSQLLYQNIYPLYIFILKNKSQLKGILDLEREYLTYINQAYQRVIKQNDYQIILGDDQNKDENINEDDYRKNSLFLSEDECKLLMQQVEFKTYYNQSILKLAEEQFQSIEPFKRVNYLRKTKSPFIIKQIVLIASTFPFIFEKTYCLPGQELPISEVASQNQLYTELENFHQEIIEQQWKQNELQLHFSSLLNGYYRIYQKHNTEGYPKIENILYKINVDFVFSYIKIEDFVKFIKNNCRVYYLQMINGLFGYENSYIQQKLEQLKIQLYLDIFEKIDFDENHNIIELELNDQQQGSKNFYIMVHLLVNSPHVQQFQEVFEKSILERLKIAHKNFMAYQLWNKIKVNKQLNGQEFAFLTQYCQQIQTKKLAKEIRFEQLDDTYKQKIFNVEKFQQLKQCYIVDNQKSIVIVNGTEDVLYIIDLQVNMIENIRILYLMTDNPSFDQEKIIKPHYDECTQLIKKSIDEMI